MDIVAIVLNWENFTDTNRLLEGLDQFEPGVDVRIVDNGSNDNSVEQLESDGRNIIRLNSNRGFAGGMNAGIRNALDDDADAVLLMNNDIIINGSFVDELSESLSRSDDIGAVSPVIDSPDGDPWFRSAVVDMKTGKSYRKEEASENRELLKTDYIPLACTLIPAYVFEDIGTLDSSYFLYKEDVDFAVRASKAGYQFVTDPSVTIIHESGSSSDEATKRYYGLRNRWIFARKFNIPRSSFYPFFLNRFVESIVGRVIKGEFTALPAVFEGTLDGVRGKTGKGRYP